MFFLNGQCSFREITIRNFRTLKHIIRTAADKKLIDLRMEPITKTESWVVYKQSAEEILSSGTYPEDIGKN